MLQVCLRLSTKLPAQCPTGDRFHALTMRLRGFRGGVVRRRYWHTYVSFLKVTSPKCRHSNGDFHLRCMSGVGYKQTPRPYRQPICSTPNAGIPAGQRGDLWIKPRHDGYGIARTPSGEMERKTLNFGLPDARKPHRP